MSRLDEVEAEITAILRKTKRPQLAAAAIARTLAAEVDARDEVITKLLALYKPEKRPENWKRTDMDKPEYHAWCLAVPLYARACEIAGRTE